MIVVCQSEEDAADHDAYRHFWSREQSLWYPKQVNAQQKDGDVAWTLIPQTLDKDISAVFFFQVALEGRQSTHVVQHLQQKSGESHWRPGLQKKTYWQVVGLVGQDTSITQACESNWGSASPTDAVLNIA
jgi:hypothetical protein